MAGTVEGYWTCGVLIGKTREGKFVVTDVRRMRGTPDKVQAFILEVDASSRAFMELTIGRAPMRIAQEMVDRA